MFLMTFYCITFLQANDITSSIEKMSIKKEFLIAKSTTNYQEAKHFAKRLSHSTGIRLDFRGLNYNKKLMLSASKNICQKEYFDFPCYIARGRYDDGVYISIEYSGAYENFKDGYYIVIVDSGTSAKRTLNQVKRVVTDAYVKTSKVYMGCMH